MKNPNQNISHDIDDPIAWVEEHYLIAGFINSLTDLQENIRSQYAREGFEYNESGELIIDNQLKNRLKANYSEANWQYLANTFNY
ncbi:MAG: hypothetical protein ACRC2J_18635 [Microcoleaceae cyanobacterium]